MHAAPPADAPTLPDEDARPGASRAEAIAAFAKDCHATLKATAYVYEEEEKVAECLARDVDQNCNPDYFGCYGELDTCQVKCQPVCTRCQDTCGGSCDDCMARCAEGDASCLRTCAEARADCRERCMLGLRRCQSDDCDVALKTCDTKALEHLRGCDVEKCDAYIDCYNEADDYEHADERCQPKMAGMDPVCQDVCATAHELPMYLLDPEMNESVAAVEDGASLAKACTSAAQCPADYATLAPYLASFCAGMTTDASFAALEAELAHKKISKRSLALVFNAYGAIHGYVFKKEKWMNGFFYGDGGAWLPSACRKRMKTVASAKVMPLRLTKLRDRFKKLWSATR